MSTGLICFTWSLAASLNRGQPRRRSTTNTFGSGPPSIVSVSDGAIERRRLPPGTPTIPLTSVRTRATLPLSRVVASLGGFRAHSRLSVARRLIVLSGYPPGRFDDSHRTSRAPCRRSPSATAAAVRDVTRG